MSWVPAVAGKLLGENVQTILGSGPWPTLQRKSKKTPPAPAKSDPRGNSFLNTGQKPKVIAYVLFKNGFYLGETHCHHHPVNCAKCVPRTFHGRRNGKAAELCRDAGMSEVPPSHPAWLVLEGVLPSYPRFLGKRGLTSLELLFFSCRSPQPAVVHWIDGSEPMSGF